MKNRRVLQMLV